jgi:sn-glycerol 3-phosphate transport system substrate-binding protein
MIRKSLVALAVLFGFATSGVAQTEIQWWHSMAGLNGDKVNDLAGKFNASQNRYKVVPVYKGSYPESDTAPAMRPRSCRSSRSARQR